MNNTYAQSVTGLFHSMPSPGTTTCGQSTDEPDLIVVPADVAMDWLTDHPWDLCRNCKEKGE